MWIEFDASGVAAPAVVSDDNDHFEGLRTALDELIPIVLIINSSGPISQRASPRFMAGHCGTAAY